jgi:hypothetical protein
VLGWFVCLPPDLAGVALRSCASLASFAASLDVRVVLAVTKMNLVMKVSLLEL